MILCVLQGARKGSLDSLVCASCTNRMKGAKVEPCPWCMHESIDKRSIHYCISFLTLAFRKSCENMIYYVFRLIP